MRDPYANHDDEEESWLTDHKKFHQQEEDRPPSRKQRKRQRKLRRRKNRKRPPIHVSNELLMCRICDLDAPKETLRRGKCLACQVTAYLNTR